MVIRENYLSKIRPFIGKDIIKGDRRKVCVNDKKGQYEKQRLSQEWK